MIITRWNTRELVDTGARLRQWKKMDVPQFVRHRARVLNQDLIKWTPPRGPSPSKETFKHQKQLGEKTLRRDVYRVFTPIDSLKMVVASVKPRLGAALQKLLETEDLSGLVVLLRRCGVRFAGILRAPAPEIHQKARTKRGGVPRKVGWLVPHRAQIEAYLKKMMPDVGKAKSGWGAGARWLGVPAKNWPLWIQKHGDNGSYEDRLHDPDRPVIRLINDRPEVKDFDPESVVDAAIAINEVKMEIELKAIEASMKLKWAGKAA